MPSVIISSPIREYKTADCVWYLLTHGSSLFIGLFNGSIEEWTEPQKCKQIFSGHNGPIHCLLVVGDILWSGSVDGIKRWDISNGECITTIRTVNSVFCFVEWKGHVITQTEIDSVSAFNADVSRNMWYLIDDPHRERCMGDLLFD